MGNEKHYQCDICKRIYKQKRWLRHHIRYHPGNDGLYQCDLCPKTFRFQSGQMKHLQSHRGDFTCIVCSRKFSSLQRLKYHRERNVCANKEGKFRCDLCFKTYTNVIYLRNHQAIYHFRGKKKFCCYLCPMEFSEKSKLNHHHQSSHQQFKNSADAPNFGKPEIVEHGITVRPHSNENLAIRTEFQCGVCHKILTRKMRLRKHMKLHFTAKKMFTCDTCQKNYFNRQHFICHLKTHSEPFRCNVCSKNYSTAQWLREHKCRVVRSTEGEVFQCKLCDNKAYKTRAALKYHEVKKHNTDIPDIYCCDLCEVEFSLKKDLRNHQPTHAKYKHLGNGLHVTNLCRSETAEEHVGAQDSGTVFKCRQCEMTLSSNFEALQHYTYAHTNVEEESFWCDMCEEKFSTKKDIRRHIKNHDKILQWHFCENRLECKHSLKYHLRFHSRKNAYPDKNVQPEESVAGRHRYNFRPR